MITDFNIALARGQKRSGRLLELASKAQKQKRAKLRPRKPASPLLKTHCKGISHAY